MALAVRVLVGPLARSPEGGATSFEGSAAAGERHEHGECLLVLVRLELAAWLGLGLSSPLVECAEHMQTTGRGRAERGQHGAYIDGTLRVRVERACSVDIDGRLSRGPAEGGVGEAAGGAEAISEQARRASHREQTPQRAQQERLAPRLVCMHVPIGGGGEGEGGREVGNED